MRAATHGCLDIGDDVVELAIILSLGYVYPLVVFADLVHHCTAACFARNILTVKQDSTSFAARKQIISDIWYINASCSSVASPQIEDSCAA